MNGLELEEPTEDLAEANLGDDAELVELGNETITPDEYLYDFSFPEDGRQAQPPPLDQPPMADRYAEIVKYTFADPDPGNAAYYEDNYARLRLGRPSWTRSPHGDRDRRSEDRTLLTYHDAYAYFADEYGWEVIGAIQPSDFAEPSAQEMADLIAQVRATGCRPSSAPRSSPARSSSRSARRRACATSTCCATTTCPASRATPTTRGSG